MQTSWGFEIRLLMDDVTSVSVYQQQWRRLEILAKPLSLTDLTRKEEGTEWQV